MPLANRPNTPRRLPSTDLEDLFFSAWALRRSEGSSATERSQEATSGSIPTSPVSPFTHVPDRKLRSADRKKFLSEPIVLDPPPPLRGSPPLLEPTYSPPITIYEESAPLQRRASTATSSIAETSLQSSVGLKARKILGFPSTRLSSHVAKDVPPPHRARQGFRWIRANSGNWLETRIGKKQSASVSQGSSEIATSPGQALTQDHSMNYDDRRSILVIEPPSSQSPKVADSTLQLSRTSTLKSGSTDPFLSPTYPKEGLYCRTKRALGLKNDPVIRDESSTAIYERAMTGETGLLLDRTSSALRYLATKGREPTNLSTAPSNLSIASPRSATRWKQLRTGLASSTTSSSNSLRSLMKRRPPPPSPEPQSMYTGSDRNQYFSIELTDPDAPTFLPSEARRIMTPPLGPPSALGPTKRHDFFEYKSPHSLERTLSVGSKSTAPLTMSNGSRAASIIANFMQIPAGEAQKNAAGVPGRISETERHRFEMQAIDGYEGLSSENFIMNTPEHLPTSPICPKHPKHKSGGKGVCVYHGRNTAWDVQVASPS